MSEYYIQKYMHTYIHTYTHTYIRTSKRTHTKQTIKQPKYISETENLRLGAVGLRFSLRGFIVQVQGLRH